MFASTSLVSESGAPSAGAAGGGAASAIINLREKLFVTFPARVRALGRGVVARGGTEASVVGVRGRGPEGGLWQRSVNEKPQCNAAIRSCPRGTPSRMTRRTRSARARHAESTRTISEPETNQQNATCQHSSACGGVSLRRRDDVGMGTCTRTSGGPSLRKQPFAPSSNTKACRNNRNRRAMDAWSMDALMAQSDNNVQADAEERLKL
jgi:hypothetical protein